MNTKTKAPKTPKGNVTLDARNSTDFLRTLIDSKIASAMIVEGKTKPESVKTWEKERARLLAPAFLNDSFALVDKGLLTLDALYLAFEGIADEARAYVMPVKGCAKLANIVKTFGRDALCLDKMQRASYARIARANGGAFVFDKPERIKMSNELSIDVGTVNAQMRSSVMPLIMLGAVIEKPSRESEYALTATPLALALQSIYA